MLEQSLFDDVRGSFNLAIDMLGVPSTWTQAKPPNATATPTIGFRTAGLNDTEVVSAYGIGAKIVTMKVTDFTVAPQKFDTIEVLTERYTLDAVNPVHLNGVVIGYKAYIRGK